MNIKKSSNILEDIIDNVSKVIIGKEDTIKLIVLSLISEGHVLIEDVPGVGKTSLVNALARSIDCNFNRIQFTPDILPSDITGFSMYNQKTNEFEFMPGAIMSNFVLADEINRASAKAQSSLLEVMEERQVTVDSKTYKLAEPFMVFATQNPIDNLGTYELPKAQIDRFQIKVSVGYPDIKEEIKIINMRDKDKKELKPVATGEDIMEAIKIRENIKVEESVSQYIVELVDATRNHADIKMGASPRASIALYRMGQALALYNGRDYVIHDDIKYLAPYVLSHRLVLGNDAKINNKDGRDLVKEILEETRVLLKAK